MWKWNKGQKTPLLISCVKDQVVKLHFSFVFRGQYSADLCHRIKGHNIYEYTLKTVKQNKNAVSYYKMSY